VEEQAQAALGGRERYQRRAARPRAIATATGSGSTFGALRVSLPRVRLLGGDSREGDGRGEDMEEPDHPGAGQAAD